MFTQKFNVPFLTTLLLLLLMTIITGCGTRGPAPDIYAEGEALEGILPEDTYIRYGVNGTPSYIKGKNLSSLLDGDEDFSAYKEMGSYPEVATLFLESLRELLKIDDPRRELKVTGVSTDKLQLTRVRLQQVSGGIPIWGRELSLYLNKEREVYLLQGRIEPTLKGMSLEPLLTAEGAAGEAVKAVSREGNGVGKWTTPKTERYVFMVGDEVPRLAYRITLVKGKVEREFYFIDAMDGKVLHRLSGKVELKGPGR